MSGKENNITAQEENNMSLSEVLDKMISLRNACYALGLQEYVDVIETMVFFFIDAVKQS